MVARIASYRVCCLRTQLWRAPHWMCGDAGSTPAVRANARLGPLHTYTLCVGVLAFLSRKGVGAHGPTRNGQVVQ
jgi:hypothetical protein